MVMENSFWMFVGYVSFIFLMLAVLLIYGLVRRTGWWYIPAVLCILILAFAVDFRAIIFSPGEIQTGNEVTNELTIPKGANLSNICGILKEKGVIQNIGQFRWITRLLGYETGIKAGKFQITGPYSYYDLLKILHKGGNVQEKVTIREGLRATQVAGLLARMIGLDSTRFFELTQDSGFCASLDIPANNLEGFLLPETYYFYWGININKHDRRFYELVIITDFKMGLIKTHATRHATYNMK